MINLSFNTGFHFRSPQIYRYSKSQFVDDFLSSGKLRLSSFEKYRKHDNPEIEDSLEGSSLVEGILFDGHIFAVGKAIPNAYILCASSIKSVDLLEAFESDNCYVISDPIAFANEVARHVPGCTDVLYGPCNYQYKVEQYRPDIKVGLLEGKTEQEKMKISQEILSEVVKSEFYFQKSRRYIHQHEYRFVFITNVKVEEHLDLISLSAARLCMKVSIAAYERSFEQAERHNIQH